MRRGWVGVAAACAVVVPSGGCARTDENQAVAVREAGANASAYLTCEEAATEELAARGIVVPATAVTGGSYLAFGDMDGDEQDISGRTADQPWSCAVTRAGGEWTVTSLLVGPEAEAPDPIETSGEPTFEPSGPPGGEPSASSAAVPPTYAPSTT